jgi:homocysteine S-methyltransferase
VSGAKTHGAAVKPFLERLQEGVVVCDGAMGTMLYSRGVFVNRCFDELNLSSPGLVRAVHEEYLDAGADVVETNTFGAHRLKLAPHGYENQVAKINSEGARLAREAAQGRGLVAGSMGPLGKPLEPFGNIALAQAVEVYREQAEGLIDGGVDLFTVETMPSLDQARAAVDAIRSVSALPIAVALTFNEEGTTFYGDKPEDVVRTLEDWDVQVVGANCSQGPMPMLETVQRMAAVAKRVKLSAMPNAGAPALVDGRYVYLCTPEYMASYERRFIKSGVAFVGG